MNSKPTSNKNTYVARDDVMRLLNNHIGDYSVYDLGWWLETKTANSFTVVELEFIKKAFAIICQVGKSLEEISKSVEVFEKEWIAKVRSQQL